METPKAGLCLALKKRKLFLAKDDTESFDYLLFGSYDGVQIFDALRWRDLAPSAASDERAAGIDFSSGTYLFEEEHFSNTFLMKLLYPQEMPNSMDYAFWGQERQASLCPERPFFVMSMMNISAELARKVPKSERLFRRFSDRLKAAYAETPTLKDMHCALFPTFGCYDLVLLARCASFHEITNLVNTLRKVSVTAEDRKRYPGLSATYTVIGISPSIRGELDSAGLRQVVLEFQLKLGGRLPQMPRAFGVPQSSFGGRDIAYFFDGEKLGSLFQEYFKDGKLNPGNPTYSDNVIAKRTWFYSDSGFKGKTFTLPSVPVELVIGADWGRIFSVYHQLREKANRTQRLTTALRQTVLRYCNLSFFDHEFEARRLLKPAFDTLFQCMDGMNAQISGMPQKDATETWEKYDHMLHAFREAVGGFLNDLALSDKHFMDDSQLKHPSIGSATKLIFVYHYLVSRLLDHLDSDTTVVVTSGGSDVLRVENITYDLPLDAARRLFVIELPELVLYQIPVALFAVLHEGFHVPPRAWDYSLIAQLIARYSEYTLTNILAHFDDVFKELKLCIKDFDAVALGFRRTFADIRARFGNAIYKHICKCFTPCCDYHSLYREMEEVFLCGANYRSDDRAKQENFADELLRRTCDFLREAYQQFSAELHKRGYLPVNYADILANQYRVMADALNERFQEKGDRKNEELLRLELLQAKADVIEASNQLLGGFDVYLPGSEKSASFGVTGFPFMPLMDVLNVVTQAADECYSDIHAVKTLKMSLEQYMLTLFNLKDGSIDEVIPDNLETVLRIGCTAETAFGITELADFQRKKDRIIEALNRAMVGDIYCDYRKITSASLYQRFEKLLEGYFFECYRKNGMIPFLRAQLDEWAVPAISDPQLVARMRSIYLCAVDPAQRPGLQRGMLDLWLAISSYTEQ